MAIACAYCNGEHDSPAQVRQCWQERGQQEIPLSGGDALPAPDETPNPAGPPPAVAASTPRGVDRSRSGSRPPRRPAPVVARGAAAAVAGPDQLGRHALVDPGCPPPSAWDGAERVVVSDQTLADPAPTLARLRAAHHRRERLVIELDTDLDHEISLMVDDPPFALGPDFSFDLDELVHLVWSNTVDLRDPDRPIWIGLDTAIAAGAAAAPGAMGDVVLADGGLVWLDGGPIRHTDPIDGIPVVHTVVVEHGSLRVPGPNTSTADLAPDQLEAVTHEGGAARIIAPAGSGKTRVLTERARHLLTTWNLPPGAVSLVAFNKRAQEEMKERTADLPDLQVRTLNAIGLAIVNGTAPFAPQPQRWNTIDELEVRRIIGDLVSFPRRRNSDPVAPWIEALSLIRLGLVTPEEAERRYDGDVDGLAAMWPSYRAALERRQAVDFDDQIYRALLVLLTQPEARRVAQRASRVMLVDEFQDLTPAHLLLIRLLASPGGAVFGVGDDDQTIYGYNGADPAWLIDFAQLFPGAGSHPLEVNYRCPAGIVDIVDRLLRHNKRRVAKTIRASSTDENGWSIDGSPDPVGATCAAVSVALASGSPASDIAVLSRVNALLAPVQVALVARGTPVAGGVGLEFVERTAIRTVLAWIRLATSGSGGPNQFNAEDVREALRRPSRSFHPRINDWVTEQGSVADLERLAGRLNNEKDAGRLLDFAADIQTLQRVVRSGAPTSDLIASLIDDIGLAGAVTTLDAHRRGMNRAAQGDDLTAIQHLAALHDDPVTFGSWLRDHLAVKRSPEGVTLATVHRVKGQEWPHVVVHLADAEQYPHRLAEDVEEERRLFHVAITRASVNAAIVTGPRPSPFVEELTAEPSEDRVVSLHPADSPKKSSSRPGASKADPIDELDDEGQRRFAALRDLRNELRDGKPAYVVFDNKTLAAIARTAPSSKAELLRISGVGPAKIEKYGDAVIELIARLKV